MTERPILFTTEMVKAVLAGTKTQTRRVIQPKLQAAGKITRIIVDENGDAWQGINPVSLLSCHYGKPGDHLWVRETWNNRDPLWGQKIAKTAQPVIYKADGGGYSPWIPSVHMPRWAGRINLEITNVRVERVQDISEEDAKAEGCTMDDDPYWRPTGFDPDSGGNLSYKNTFSWLWDSINEKRGLAWSVNPWVWVIEFRRIH